MPELPRNQAMVESYIGDLDELLQKPFHIQGYLSDASGKRNALGLAVGRSWVEHRHAVAIALPFVAEAAPTDATAGVALYPYEQARLYLEFTGPLAGTEAMTVRIWHRHAAYDDVMSFGPWTMWKEIDNITHMTEHLDNGLFHREIYIQLMTYGPAAATATGVNVWVAGATGIVESAFADVNIDAGNIEVQIEAIPDDPGEKSDSAVMAGTLDGQVPTIPAPNTVYALRVRKGGYQQSFLAVEQYDAVVQLHDRMLDANDELSRIAGYLEFSHQYGELAGGRGYFSPPAQQIIASGQDVRGILNPQGYGQGVDLAVLRALGYRKIVGVGGNGAYTSPAAAGGTVVSFTGVNLLGRIVLVFNESDNLVHVVSNVVDPTGGAAGTFTVFPPVRSATPTLTIPFRDLPYAYNSAADAMQAMLVVGPPPRINGPATFLSVGAAVIGAGTTQYPIPCALYGGVSFEITWTSAGTTLLQFNAYAKPSDTAWPAAGTIPAAYNRNLTFSYPTGSTQFGAAPALTGTINADLLLPRGWNSIMIEMVASVSGGNTPTTGTYTLFGGGK